MKILLIPSEDLMKKTIKNFYEVFKYKKNELKNKKTNGGVI